MESVTKDQKRLVFAAAVHLGTRPQRTVDQADSCADGPEHGSIPGARTAHAAPHATFQHRSTVLTRKLDGQEWMRQNRLAPDTRRAALNLPKAEK